MFIQDKRLGRFEITADVINEHPDVVQIIMASVIVLEATNHFSTGTVKYVALCGDFDEIEPGAVIPDYDPEFDPDTGQTAWVKV